ncbi:MAG: hypothetical protein H6721_28210 [Sandaracinus sp.]|nr:hypothetical protein [Sandaracinus sp.]MCB9636013.1 hypothetical protein [Sandaracinus sp.]
MAGHRIEGPLGGGAMGTVYRARATVDTRADVYALGVMLFELCTGERPFPQDALGKILAAQLTADPPRLATRASGVPPELDALVASMLTSSRQTSTRVGHSKRSEESRHVGRDHDDRTRTIAPRPFEGGRGWVRTTLRAT